MIDFDQHSIQFNWTARENIFGSDNAQNHQTENYEP